MPHDAHAPSPATIAPHLTEAEAAALLGVSPRTLQRWRKHRIAPPHYRFGPRTIRYPRHDLHAWVERATAPTNPA